MTDTPDSGVASARRRSILPKIGGIPISIDLQEGKVIPRRQVLAWATWDWGTAAFNAVITTFVFTVYITGSLFVPPAIRAAYLAETNIHGPAHHALALAEAPLSSGLAFALAIAGGVVAILSPIIGFASDATGHRKIWLGVSTGLVVLTTASMFFVQGQPSYFVLGVTLVAVGTVFYEIATVNYNAMLLDVSTPKTIGKVSALGWASGYLGGIVLLLIVYFGIVVEGSTPGVGGFLHVSEADGLNIRIIALICAVWTIVFSIPILVAVPEQPLADHARVTFGQSFLNLFRDVRDLWKVSRNVILFLIASALFRDGLVGVFTFGGILASGTFGFSTGQVIIFAIAANVVAGVSTLISGRFDDRFGAKPVIVVALIGLVIAGTATFFAHDGGQTAFWIGGLILCLFVGPAQSASRTFLARLAPAGHEGEVFGLYNFTGRAVSFLAPLLFGVFIAAFGEQYWGILGIVLVLFVGLLLLIPVRSSLTKRDAS
jgi:UMF1 family MFS transporter